MAETSLREAPAAVCRGDASWRSSKSPLARGVGGGPARSLSIPRRSIRRRGRRRTCGPRLMPRRRAAVQVSAWSAVADRTVIDVGHRAPMILRLLVTMTSWAPESVSRLPPLLDAQSNNAANKARARHAMEDRRIAIERRRSRAASPVARRARRRRCWSTPSPTTPSSAVQDRFVRGGLPTTARRAAFDAAHQRDVLMSQRPPCCDPRRCGVRSGRSPRSEGMPVAKATTVGSSSREGCAGRVAAVPRVTGG